MTLKTPSSPEGYRFGTFDGVFLPSVLTILGVVMYMRLAPLVGSMGILGALGILAVGESIALATGLSLAAISTNTPVQGGGPYFLISRALGPGFGAAIGLTYYVAQALSVPFYILGFTEALTTVFPALGGHALLVSLVPLVILFAIGLIGADWAVKTQYLIASVLALSIIVVLGGAIASGPTAAQFTANLHASPDLRLDFTTWIGAFAIFFPAVTGFLAGVNMSGDLANPRRAIPRGVLGAILTGLAIYLLEILLFGAAWERGALESEGFGLLHGHALFGLGFLVLAGVMAATLSSALGTLVGAPRVLQAFAADGLVKPLKPFAWGRGAGNDPLPAMVLTFFVALATILWGHRAGDGGSDNALNMVARLVTMFMLCTYALVNLSAAMESFAANPSFRPNFRLFHWSIGIYGAVLSLAVACFISFPLMLLSLAVIAILFMMMRRHALENTFGDARRGYFYERVRIGLQRLAQMPPDPKNWRPQIAVMAGNLEKHRVLIEYAELLNNRRGILTVGCILPVQPDEAAPEELRQARLQRMSLFSQEERLPFFPVVATAAESGFDDALNVLLQAHSLGPLTPNIALLGWASDPARLDAYSRHIGVISRLRKSCVLLLNGERACPPEAPSGTVDVWWRGRDNGALMLLLAYLLTCNDSWRKCPLRLLRIAAPHEAEAARQELRQLSEEARIHAECVVLAAGRPFRDVLLETSASAAVLFMGFIPPGEGEGQRFHDSYQRLLEGMPMTFLVASAGDARLSS